MIRKMKKFRKTLAAKLMVGAFSMGILASPVSANLTWYDDGTPYNGIANHLDGSESSIWTNGGENRTEKGSPWGWKAGVTVFGALIDASPDHWGNSVLSADVNQLYIPDSVKYYAPFAFGSEYYQGIVNAHVAEANGFGDVYDEMDDILLSTATDEMKKWIMANLNEEYKGELAEKVFLKFGGEVTMEEAAKAVEAAVSGGAAEAADSISVDLDPADVAATLPDRATFYDTRFAIAQTLATASASSPLTLSVDQGFAVGQAILAAAGIAAGVKADITNNVGITANEVIGSVVADVLDGSVVGFDGVSINVAAGLTDLELAVVAVEVGTQVGIAAGLEPGVARDAAEKAVEDETGISRQELQAAAGQ